jgi:hypothetical protein
MAKASPKAPKQQHEQAAGHGEEEELHRRVDPPLPSPDADDEVHRHQHDFPEDIEEEEIVGEKGSQDTGCQKKEGDREPLPVSLDSFPRGEDDDRQQERGQGDQGHRDAVHHEVVGDAETIDPGNRLAVDQVAYGFEAPRRRESPKNKGRGQGEME